MKPPDTIQANLADFLEYMLWVISERQLVYSLRKMRRIRSKAQRTVNGVHYGSNMDDYIRQNYGFPKAYLGHIPTSTVMVFNMKKADTLGRMWHIIRMWRMVNIFRELRITQALEVDPNEVKKDEFGFQKAWDAQNSGVRRMVVANTFALKHVPIIEPEEEGAFGGVQTIPFDGEKTDLLLVEETKRQLFKAQALLDETILAGFLRQEGNTIFITKEGSFFATFTGLVKEIIIQIGIVITFFVSVSAALVTGVYGGEFMRNIIHHIQGLF